MSKRTTPFVLLDLDDGNHLGGGVRLLSVFNSATKQVNDLPVEASLLVFRPGGQHRMELRGQSQDNRNDFLNHRASIHHLATTPLLCYHNATEIVPYGARMVKSIPLTQGKVAFVDDEDFERVSQYRWSADKRNGRLGPQWYASRKDWRKGHGVKVYLHRFILDAPSHLDVDHGNGDGLDNRRDNIRLCTTSQNAANQRRESREGRSSRFRGVTWNKNDRIWIAQITVQYQNIIVGRFHDEVAAARAYNNAARTAFGEFARLNILAVGSDV